MGMEFEVTFRGDHIHVQLNAATRIEDPDLPNDYWGMLRKLCDEYDCRKILVEGVAPSGEMDPVEVVEAGERAATVLTCGITGSGISSGGVSPFV
jgi:hypothetical protein